MDSATTTTLPAPRRLLPRIGTPAYHALLGAVAILILGPLGGISASFMNFSIGFFVSGQVLAGILGSTVTVPYGPEGKHGGNYIQTMAASVAGMCAMSVLLQAMVWLGLPEPAFWKISLYFLCIGMFGVGIGMLYTPLLVDRMRLTYPSGYAVANILRALTDKSLLKRSIVKLGSGMGAGFGVGVVALNLSWLRVLGVGNGTIDKMKDWGISSSTFGAGMIVGARLAIPALVVALIGYWQTPNLTQHGWLQPGQTYRKIGYIISLGAILGAAVLDIVLILIKAARRYLEQSKETAEPVEDWKRVNTFRLVLWVICWGAGVMLVGNLALDLPVKFLAVAVGLCFLFVLVNGISQGISDWNPISSAFVLTVFILVAFGLKDPSVGLMCAAILMIATSAGCDMQQDRSTGWRLGTNRVIQFRYQVIGIVMGAVLAVVLAKFFMHAFPVLQVDQYTHQDVPEAKKWQSAMTLKLVGTLKGITNKNPHVMTALRIGILLGLAIEITRKLIKLIPGYKRFAAGSVTGRTIDFLLDAVLLGNPYASALGGFVELSAVYWWTTGGVSASLFEAAQKRRSLRAVNAEADQLPSDISAKSLVGGGLIAGDSLAALAVGICVLLKTMFWPSS